MAKKGRKMNDDDYLTSLGAEDDELVGTTSTAGDDEDDDFTTSTNSTKPKKANKKQNNKKKGPSANAFSLLEDDEDNSSSMNNDDEENDDDDDDIYIPKAQPKKQNKKNKKKPAAKFADLEDLDDEMDNLESQLNSDDDDDEADKAPPSKKQDNSKKGKNNKQQQQKGKKKGKSDDDYLASLAADAEELETEPAPVEEKKKPAADNKKKPQPAAAEEDDDDDDEDDGGIPLDQRDPSTLSAKDKKKLKKMRQKESQKQPTGKKDEKKKDEKKKDDKKKDDKKKGEKKEDASKKAPAKKVNSRIAELKALMEQKKAEEERLRKEEERKIRDEQDALRLLEQQRREEELEKQKQKDEKKKKLKELKDKGLWKSKKQLEQEKAARERVEMLIQQGLISGMQNKSNNNNNKSKKPKKAAEPKKAAPAKTSEPKKVEKPVEKKPQKEPEEEVEDWEKEETEEEEAVEDWEDLEDVLEESSAKKKEEEKKKKKAEEERKKKEAEEKKRAEELAKKKEEEDDDEYFQRADAEETNKHKGNADLRSPICCVLGHVDTGKTKLLDKIRNTNVQTGEAGGITQQIGATYVPIEAVKRQTKKLNEMTKGKLQYGLPGLLIIDTPGHESFTNLRSRGSSLCDIAILVVDILHGLERQTLESIQLLRQRKTPFIVALNKIDTIYGWKASPNAPIKETLKNQSKHTLEQFEDNVKKTIYLFNEQGFNAEVYYKNKDVQNYVSLVPTSAITGEGLPDLLALMCQLCQKHMTKRITLQSKFQCTILEVKVIDGYGTTIDVILSNGLIREGDKIVVCGLNGPIVTNIRALLTPQPLRELRVKGEYMHHKEIRASQGIKIAAPDLEGAVPGSQVLLVREGDDVEDLKDEVMSDLNEMLSRINKSGRGVYVQSSTLGSLEALLEFLHSEKIPVSGINIGPVHKKDIVKTSVMLDSHPEYAVLLAFDVPVSKEAEMEAKNMGVTIFRADIIYHLFDQFMAHKAKVKEAVIKNTEKEAVWPCVLKISESNIFRKKDPITVGVDVVEGVLRMNTPLIIPTKANLVIGRVIGIQHQKTSIREAERGKSVAIQIDSGKTITYGRHFDHTDLLYSRVTRESIDLLKELFSDELKNNHDLLVLLVKLKKVLNIQ